MSKAEREADHPALDMVQMGKFKNRRPAQLSGGSSSASHWPARWSLIPKLVLMDEPLARWTSSFANTCSSNQGAA